MVAATETILLEIDWDNDGTFGHGSANVSADVLDLPRYFIGRDNQSQLQGRSTAGGLTATLRNDDDKYSPKNTGSAIFGKILPNRRVRLKSKSNGGTTPLATSAQFVRVNNECLTLADNASVSTGDIAFGIEAWIYLDSKNNNMVIVGKYTGAGDLREYRLRYSTSADRITLRLSPDGTSTGQTDLNADSFGAVPTGVWIHVITWHDPILNTMNIQVDDGPVDSVSYSAGLTDLTSPFEIGADGAGNGKWDGRIAAVTFAKRVWTSTERTWMDNDGKGQRYADFGVVGDGADMKTSLSSRWELDETSGNRGDAHGSNTLTDVNTVTSATGVILDYTVQWHGYLDTIIPTPAFGGMHEARLEAFGVLAKAQARRAYVAPAATVLTGTAVTSVLDAVGFPAGDRVIDAGRTTMNRHFVAGDWGADALHDIEETDFGFIRETKNAEIAFEDRHHRFGGAHLTSQATYTDAVDPTAIFYQAIPQTDAIQGIVNIIRAKVRRQTVASIATLWNLPFTGSDSPVLGVGESITFIAEYPTPNAPTEDIGVSIWTDPAASTDYTANSQSGGGGTDLTGDVGIATVKSIKEMEITVTNNGSVKMFLTALAARGTALQAEHEVWVQFKDTASIADFEEREYTIPAKFLPDTNQAADYCRYVASLNGNPVTLLAIEYIANENQAAMDDALARDVSDRVTVTANGATGLGINDGYFVERMGHSINRDGVHTVQLDLSEADGSTGLVIVLDTGPGIDTGVLGY